MILPDQFEIDPLLWGTDTSTYFLTGKGHWVLKTTGASVEKSFFSDMTVEVELKFRVRTGSATNSTEYIPSYKVEVNGIVIPMILDTSKPNEKRIEFGKPENIFNSHIGYIKGKALFKEGENTLKLTGTRQFGAIENWIEVIPPPAGVMSLAQHEAILKQNTETLKAGIAVIVSDAVAEAKAAETTTWRTKIAPLTSVVTALEGAVAEIKKVMS